jgi:Fe-S cluster assembly iron-binding protein IscA
MANANAQVALESAARIYAEKGGTANPRYVLDVADKFYTWLEDKEDSVV